MRGLAPELARLRITEPQSSALLGAATGLRSMAARGALLGGAAAIVAAYAGYHARRMLVHNIGLPDLPVALCEDVLAIGIARGALRGR